jgi:hypothetical protein
LNNFILSLVASLAIIAFILEMRSGFIHLKSGNVERRNTAAFFLICLVIYCLLAGDRVLQISVAPNHAYMAEAYVSGRLGLNHTIEEAFGNRGVFYLPQGPTPSVMMMPLAVVFGHEFSDYSFMIVLSSLTGALFMLILFSIRPNGVGLDLWDVWLYSSLFSFGTIVFVYSVYGTFWFMNQLVSVFFIVLLVLAMVRWDSPALAGASIGLSMLARYHTILFIATYYAYLAMSSEPAFWRKVKRAFVATFVLSIFIGICMAHNYLRFDNVFNTGYNFYTATYVPYDPNLIEQHMSIMLLKLPIFTSEFPYFQVSTYGLSIFLTTPLFLYMFKLDYDTPLKRSVFLGTVLFLVYSLAYIVTGWVQFGYRYTLEVTPFLVLLLALNNHKIKKGKTFYILLAFGILVNIFGAVTFKRPAFFESLYL